MSPEMISHWIQASGLATAVRESWYAYPVIMSTHLACIAVFGGMILMTDLRLMGLAMTDVPVATMIRELRPWKWVGFCIMVTCGFLLAISKMDTYYANPYFLTKLAILVLVAIHALVFRPLVYKNPEEIDRAPKLPGVAKLAGALSLILWLTLPIMGRMIAYYDPPDAIASIPAAPATRPDSSAHGYVATQAAISVVPTKSAAQ